MITTDSVIDSLGGTKAVASALSLALPTVSIWRRRGIPSKHWLPLVRLASEQGAPEVTLEALAELEIADGARP
jgi:hypothetical protein